MGKKSKKQLAKAKKIMAEALALKAEALRMKVEAVKTVDSNTEAIAYSSPEKKKHITRWMLTGGIAIVILAVAGLLGTRYFYKNRDKVAGTTIATNNINQVTAIASKETWEMPKELTEISANVFADADHIACIQDADAIIYIYNLKKKAVEKTIAFGEKGDFEGLCIVDSTHYALRADGVIFEVAPTASKPRVKQYDLPLQVEQDTESMFYDAPNNRILIGVKEKDPVGGKDKGIYSFDLKTKKMVLEPVVVLTHAAGSVMTDKDKKKSDNGVVKPSEIVINPKTRELYILNGPKSQFIIADSTGKMHTTIQLDKKLFPQPEGMCFSPSGELYISSEGKSKGGGIIARVELEYSPAR